MKTEDYYNHEILKKDSKANLGREYTQCKVCLLDTIATPEIIFDQNGISNFFYEYKKSEINGLFQGENGTFLLENIIDTIKQSGKNKPYDCITGVSGGLDSTYLMLKAKEYGLRPLVVHFDNGWNSETAVKNIENIVNKLGFDLYTLVVDWNEFKDIQLSYIKSSVIDLEAITDHAIIGTLYKLALKYNIKYILSGTNIVTEQVLPKSWVWNKADHINLIDIHSKFGSIKKLKTFPLYDSTTKRLARFKGITTIAPLNYLEYNKDLVKIEVKKQLGWQDYGGKHYESVFTRFYQGFILPVKFNVDKRKAHLSNLIFSNQITKDQAISEINNPIYPEKLLETDIDFFLKKLDLSKDELNIYLASPPRMHSDFKIETSIWDKNFFFKTLKKTINKIKI